MAEPVIICPECWGHVVEPLPDAQLFSLLGCEPRLITAVTVYRCQQRHVFAIFKLEAAETGDIFTLDLTR
jgi:hypothetical protein